MSGTSELPPPTLEEVIARLEALTRTEISREEVADWAGRWVRLPNPGIDDDRIWTAIKKLSGADLPSTDRMYLHDENDFNNWLKELRGE